MYTLITVRWLVRKGACCHCEQKLKGHEAIVHRVVLQQLGGTIRDDSIHLRLAFVFRLILF